MKKLIFNFGVYSVLFLLSVACSNSKVSGTSADSASPNLESTDEEVIVEEQPAIDPNAPLTAEDEAEVLEVLKQIHLAQYSSDMDAKPFFSKQLIKRIEEAPQKNYGMGLGICFYGGGTERAEIDPESIKIVKFDPATGTVSYKLEVKLVDDIDGSTFIIHPKETATFVREDGKIVLDKTTAETMLS